MNWTGLVVVAALVVWIILHLIRNQEEQAMRRRRAVEVPPPDEPQAKPASDVDRFLQEINHLRRQAAEMRGQPPKLPETVPVAVPAVEVVPPKPVPLPVPAAVVAEAKPARPAGPQPATRLRRTAVAPPTETVHPASASTIRQLPSSPAIAQLHSLLRNPQTMQTAVLLREVLGPPRCRRKGGNARATV